MRSFFAKYYLGWAGHVACVGERRNLYSAIVDKPGSRKPLGRPCFRWEDNIKINVTVRWMAGVDWTDLAQNRDRCQGHVNAVMKLPVPQSAGNFLTS